MKSFAIATMILVISHGFLASAECKKAIDCSNMSFSWSPKVGFKTTYKNSKANELDEAACAVRTLCPVDHFDANNRPVIDQAKLVIPSDIKDTAEARKQIFDDCTQAVQSQISNACYENNVWKGKGGSLYN